MADTPTISVVIPVYNGERYLAQAIESVLGQRHAPFEVLVIDDGSQDGSAAVAQRFSAPVHCHVQPNSGAGAARNRGAKMAQGEFLAFLDADDVWLSHKLERQVAAFTADSHLDMVFGYVQQFYTPELEAELKTKVAPAAEVMPGYFPGTMLVRRDAFLNVGLFATHWEVGEFIDWYLQALEAGLKSHLLREVVMKRRIHDRNMGIEKRSLQTDYARILKASLDRRRQKVK